MKVVIHLSTMSIVRLDIGPGYAETSLSFDKHGGENNCFEVEIDKWLAARAPSD